MGTITPRKRRDGTTGYTAQIRIKRNGNAHTESQTFDRRPAAVAWLKSRETELVKPGAIELAGVEDPLLSAVIDLVLETVPKKLTKYRILTTVKSYNLANLKCSKIGSKVICAFAVEIAADRGLKPQTVENYLAHLSPVFQMARPMWGYPLDPQAMADARIALSSLGLISQSDERERRPTLDELDRLLTWYGLQNRIHETSPPMRKIIVFALFSARRQEEITRIRWVDFDEGGSRVRVSEMKDPRKKERNHVWCELPSEAASIIKSMPRVDDRIFPYNTKTVSTAFTRACKILGIEDLHFHDLRHEGISRLFEMGRTIPLAAAVSGHRNWKSLQRYAQIRQIGDKYADWKWLNVVVADTL